ncbi:hypothetical protein GCM10009618_12130 [Nesterenkonia lacusekhoensis]
MVSQFGWRFWPVVWGAVGALSASLMAWGAYTDLAWGWFSAAVMLLMVPVPVVYAVCCHRGVSPEGGIGEPSRFQFRVARGVACALWVLLAAGVLAWMAWGSSELSLSASAMLIWALSLQELRVVHIVWALRRRSEEENAGVEHAGAEPAGEGGV